MAYGDYSVAFGDYSPASDYTHVPCDECNQVEIVVRRWNLKCPGHGDITVYLCYSCAPRKKWEPPCGECGNHTTPMWFQLEPLNRRVYSRSYDFSPKKLAIVKQEPLAPRTLTLRCDKCVPRNACGVVKEGWIDP